MKIEFCKEGRKRLVNIGRAGKSFEGISLTSANWGTLENCQTSKWRIIRYSILIDCCKKFRKCPPKPDTSPIAINFPRISFGPLTFRFKRFAIHTVIREQNRIVVIISLLSIRTMFLLNEERNTSG